MHASVLAPPSCQGTLEQEKLSSAVATSVPDVGYEKFTGCPHPGQNPLIVTCFREVIGGGELQMRKVEIPISKPITLSGGITSGETFDYNSFGGLTPAKQTVTGGVVGFTGLTWLEEYFSPEELRLYAVIELVAKPSNQLVEPATLPVRVHMVNPVLGNNCYIGSVSNPITLKRITGTTSPPAPNPPITGEPGSPSSTGGSGIDHLNGGTYVDNAFAAPGANGCMLTLFGFPPIAINGVINEQSALPSAAGNNRTIQEFDTETAPAALVYP